MKAIYLTSATLFLILSSACKKCQECKTDILQNNSGIEQTSSSTQEYCGDDYDNAPEEGTYNQNVGSIEQTVTITCTDK